jgi:hypothetical protein
MRWDIRFAIFSQIRKGRQQYMVSGDISGR